MELSLSRVDLLQVGSTARNNVRLLPISKKSTQKVVVGDNDGNVTCFGMKKGKADQSFKSGPLTKECTALSLGGGAKGNNFIFAAHGRNITGFSRKGKNIYEHQSPQTEDINNLQVIQSEERIFAAGDFVLTETAHGREENLFMANDKINGMLLQKPGASYETILACQDRQVRVVRGSTLVNEIGVAGPATVVTSFDTNSAFDQEFAVEERKGHQTRLAMEVEELKAKLRAADDSEAAQLEEELHTKTRELESHSANGEQNRREVLYGTESGMVGLITFVPDGQGADGSVLQHGWSIPNVRRLGGINCMGTCDITKDGRTDMLVGRDDGTLEIWSMDMGVEPSLIFSKCINESISGVECGLITAAASEDVLLSTFSGKIIAFSAATAPGPETAVADGDKKEKKKKKSKDTEDVEKGAVKRVTDKDVKKLNKELDELKKKLEKEKAKFQSGASKEQPKELIATKNSMRLKESFMLDAEDACYQLTVEIESAIDCVVLQSTAQVELVDIDSNVAIVSKTPESDASKSSKVLATFRCQEPTRRMQIKVRTTEGQNGKLTAFVVPDVAPKTSMSIRHSVKTLSLHMRVQEAELAGDARPLSSLTIQGNFSIEKAHAWCANCLPEVPERLQGTEARFFFRATFVPSILKCAYRKGEAVFSSDSLKTLAILKDYVTR
jgi:Bardet-Biedl syndrome 7 protein